MEQLQRIDDAGTILVARQRGRGIGGGSDELFEDGRKPWSAVASDQCTATMMGKPERGNAGNVRHGIRRAEPARHVSERRAATLGRRPPHRLTRRGDVDRLTRRGSLPGFLVDVAGGHGDDSSYAAGQTTKPTSFPAAAQTMVPRSVA
jgi:hypothetical protein